MFKKRLKVVLYLALLLPLFVKAAGPGKIAKADRSLWPYKIESNKSFDIASKCEMLVFIEVLNQYNTINEVDLAAKIGVKKSNLTSVNKWKQDIKTRIVANCKNLSDVSLAEIIPIQKNSTWENLSALQLDKKMPSTLRMWYEAAQIFYTDYINEQLRLAALFPRITSEILQLSTNEIDGSNFADKNFLLTFDDGPTAATGNTDKLIKVLEKHHVKGMFFILGNSLNSRLQLTSSQALRDLYGQNSLVSHGKEHVSHQKYEQWKESLDYTNHLIQDISNTQKNTKMVYFRPPYGQRSLALSDYLQTKQAKVILWNIDSQDWNAKINAQEVADRQITLMLLWRKGILLFHDVHPKAQTAVPIIYDYFKNANLVWANPTEI